MEIIKMLNGIFWGWLVAGILLGAGVYFAVRMNFPQVRYFTKLFGNLHKSMKKSDGGISGFGALCAAVGGQVGTGSLVGVATAIASGGPGAVFWMWMTAVLGMGISFAEAVLAQLFKVKNADGKTYRGGPAYYMEKGLNNKVLATLFSISIIVGIGFIYVMIQSNSIVASMVDVTGLDPLLLGVFLLVLVCLVIFGGIKRLSDTATIIVPFMAIGYVIIAIGITIMNAEKLPALLAHIFESAFAFEPVAGGVAGYTIKEAFRYGVARGLFTNDAGNGTAPSMHATANVKHPVVQGFAAMLGTFLTTIVICSCTAFTILLTGAIGDGTTGIQLTQAAFGNALGITGNWVVFFAMFLFGYTTLLADIYYGEVNLQWIFKKSDKVILCYRLICCVLIVGAAVTPVTALWELVDFSTAFMVFFNVLALIFLFKYVLYALKDYQRQKAIGIEDPVWDFEKDITKQDLSKPFTC